MSKHHNNIIEVLKCSNATPIRGKSDIGYMCCYCADQYPDPADLKAHTLAKHDNADDPNAIFLKKKDLKKYNVKVDITGLKCKTCSEPLNNLDDLIDHLITEHKRKIYTDVKNHMIPFKFESGDLKCFICSNVYTKFKILLEHMHRHCRNFECELCGASFFNRRSLLNHEQSHNVGEFKCEQCEKVFDNVQKKQSHVRIVHVHGYLLNKCGYCNQKFPGYRMKAEHLKTVHGIGTGRIACQACDKSFSNKDSLRKHVKRHHLMESRYNCTECEMKFYSGKDLEEHMVKHTKTRSFECKVCSKRYGRQHTLREHMRIHENDRRFKCDHCGMAFVQKCSWRRHLVTKHGKRVTRSVKALDVRKI